MDRSQGSSGQDTDHNKELSETVAKHYNELKETGLEVRTQSRIFYLRNFNNWIKSVLIGETVKTLQREGREKSLVVLDLCSGKGGDLLKWKKAGISRLVCADIAGTSVEQCEVRYREMMGRGHHDRYAGETFSAEFITADCTKVRLREKYQDASMTFDLCSCQFSFHYCFESLPQAKMMLQNACECLSLGGYFIGTTPNSQEIMKRLRMSENKSFGNEVYRVTYEMDDLDSVPLFGAKYNFHLEGVVDCPEFLVYFPMLEKLADDYGMRLLYKKPFAEFFSENAEKGEYRSLLNKMQGLETYPSDGLMGTESDDYTDTEGTYQEVVAGDDRPDHVKQRGPPKVGTLSKSEWEATTIYCVFAFQKVKDIATGQTWNPHSQEGDT
uniref:mRNA cap guanine-N(7) methyltransferase n=1 Tax=Crassostrea virginica TaxID=6565 RepID=A0A8B8ETA7_CRAVI|nr:mRNA cap guanine-N7 methyltransferase-like [Crassostrea virginica]XP_022343189.1 mRNA cap guanine-N7 methyltransferase-like [Crassostrea virginica]